MFPLCGYMKHGLLLRKSNRPKRLGRTAFSYLLNLRSLCVPRIRTTITGRKIVEGAKEQVFEGLGETASRNYCIGQIVNNFRTEETHISYTALLIASLTKARLLRWPYRMYGMNHQPPTHQPPCWNHYIPGHNCSGPIKLTCPSFCDLIWDAASHFSSMRTTQVDIIFWFTGWRGVPFLAFDRKLDYSLKNS